MLRKKEKQKQKKGKKNNVKSNDVYVYVYRYIVDINIGCLSLCQSSEEGVKIRKQKRECDGRKTKKNKETKEILRGLRRDTR